MITRSQAPLGNARFAKLCLATGPTRTSFDQPETLSFDKCPAEPGRHAFPSGAWERVTKSDWLLSFEVALKLVDAHRLSGNPGNLIEGFVAWGSRLNLQMVLVRLKSSSETQSLFQAGVRHDEDAGL